MGLLSYTYGTNAFSNHEYLKQSEQDLVNLFQNQELSNPIDRYCYYNSSYLPCRIYNKIMKTIWPEQFSRPIYERRERDWAKKKKLKADIERTRAAGADIIIMYMHVGGQYNDQPTPYTKQLTDWLLQNGVDIVVGSHEHVVHGGDFSKLKQGKLATYSLGNFDGIAGVYAEPMDKMSEYSIAWHIYFDSKQGQTAIVKTSFSILKSIQIEHKKVQTVPVYDLIQKNASATEKEKLWRDTQKIAAIFSGRDVSALGPQEEYEIIVR